jgi:hypothetical protein
MDQPEIANSLSAEQRQLITEYLNTATNAADLWGQLLGCYRAGAHVEAGNIEWIAQLNGADEAVGRALVAGLAALDPQTEGDWARLQDERDPWKVFRQLGLPVEQPRPSAQSTVSSDRLTLDRDALREAYDQAIGDIATARTAPHLLNGFYKQVAEAVFETCCDALEHYIAWNAERGSAERATSDELRQTKDPTSNTVSPRLHVISAPMGAGKTTFTTAFMMGMVRLAQAGHTLPYGAVFLVDQKVKADGLYRELSEHLPGKVAIWTTAHDADHIEPREAFEPAARFRKDDLQRYTVAIVTHALFQGNTSDKARVVLHQGQEVHRALTLVDEQMQDVNVFSVQVSVAEGLREKMQTVGEDTAHMDALLKFMMQKAFSEGSLEKPASAPDGWQSAYDIAFVWFTSDHARRYAASNRERWPIIDEVFGFARCVVNDYAFIARDNKGRSGTHFIGYEPKHAIVPGMVLIDATADIDGVSQLNPWREHSKVPQGRYDRLSIIHRNTCRGEGNLKTFLTKKKNREEYAAWMRQVIQEEMEPGQKGLVVCKKVLVDTRNVPGPFPKNPAATASTTDPVYGWDLGGRQIGVTYWGGPGLGSNAW